MNFLYGTGIGFIYHNLTKNYELFFSSEIKAIVSPFLILRNFTNFFRTSFYTEDETVFKEIKKLKLPCEIIDNHKIFYY